MPRATRRRDRRTRSPSSARPLFEGYGTIPGTCDEVFNEAGGPRPGFANVVRLLDQLGRDEFRRRKRLADNAFLRGGVTFSVYSDSEGVEKIFPFDLIPRVVSARDWERVERGLTQRVTALNLFLRDLYGEQRILDDGVVPREIILGSTGFRPEVRGIVPPAGVYIHVAGIDLVRGADGAFVVLEDNVRTPSGVSYVLENRQVMKRVFPRVFQRSHVRSVRNYPLQLRRAIGETAPSSCREPRVVVLTPGPFNSAYFEHSFLARTMGCDLVQGSDLLVHGDRVFVKTTSGPTPVDVIYRRIDDDFLDPKVFRKDSVLGVPGIFRAYAAGNLTLANAIGNGVADDKAVYPYIPDVIRYYLSEEPILGQVPTWICDRRQDRQHVLEHLDELVVKAVDESGGYGMLIGHGASRQERSEFASRIRATPRKYIAQPRVELSTCPTWIDGGVRPRRVDLRPYVVTGSSSWVLPGGLTRVALVDGSYVVNSSQGGGSKDTWVMEGSK